MTVLSSFPAVIVVLGVVVFFAARYALRMIGRLLASGVLIGIVLGAGGIALLNGLT